MRNGRRLPTDHPNARVIRHLHQIDSLKWRIAISFLVLDRNIDKHNQRHEAPKSHRLNNSNEPIRDLTAAKEPDVVKSDELPDETDTQLFSTLILRFEKKVGPKPRGVSILQSKKPHSQRRQPDMTRYCSRRRH